MSMIDNFFNGISNTVQHVLGVNDKPAKPVKAEKTAQRDEATPTPRSAHRAQDVSTTYSYDPRTTAPKRESLVDRLQANKAVRDAAPMPPVAAQTPDVPAPAAPVTTAASVPTSTPRARVLDAATKTELGTVDTLGASDAAGAAAANVQRGIDYYATTFGRNGIDGAGRGVDVLIDDRSTDRNGAERFKGNGGFYTMPDANGTMREAIHFGTGNSYEAARGLVDQREMQHADDLSIHELTHGVISAETGHYGGEADEAGATNEGISDVMAAAATRDWTIGEGMFTDRSDYRKMRDIANPDDPDAIHGLWTSRAQIAEEAAAGNEFEEHWASGVVSTAAYRVQQRLGGEAGWSAVERVFYDAINGGQLGDMSFDAVAGALRTSAATLYGQGSGQAQAFDEELARGGM